MARLILLHVDAADALKQGYDAGLSDEFILPTIIGDYQGMGDGDAILMGNFRADRARQILLPIVMTKQVLIFQHALNLILHWDLFLIQMNLISLCQPFLARLISRIRWAMWWPCWQVTAPSC